MMHSLLSSLGIVKRLAVRDEVRVDLVEIIEILLFDKILIESKKWQSNHLICIFAINNGDFQLVDRCCDVDELE